MTDDAKRDDDPARNELKRLLEAELGPDEAEAALKALSAQPPRKEPEKQINLREERDHVRPIFAARFGEAYADGYTQSYLRAYVASELAALERDRQKSPERPSVSADHPFRRYSPLEQHHADLAASNANNAAPDGNAVSSPAAYSSYADQHNPAQPAPPRVDANEPNAQLRNNMGMKLINDGHPAQSPDAEPQRPQQPGQTNEERKQERLESQARRQQEQSQQPQSNPNEKREERAASSARRNAEKRPAPETTNRVLAREASAERSSLQRETTDARASHAGRTDDNQNEGQSKGGRGR